MTATDPAMGLAHEEPVFGEPWQAQAFAMAVALQRQGLFTWPEWTAALAEEIGRAPPKAGTDDSGNDTDADARVSADADAGVDADINAHASAATSSDLNARYYGHWLTALERLVAAKGATSAAELHRHRQAWDEAADRTPHGQPIVLQPTDYAR